jgi:hypothetical protein
MCAVCKTLTMQRAHITTVAMEMQQCALCVLLNYTSLSTIQKRVLHNNAFMMKLCRQKRTQTFV